MNHTPSTWLPIFRPTALVLAIACTGSALTSASLAEDEEAYDTAELLKEDHFREEFGINDFNTPSFKRIFDDLG